MEETRVIRDVNVESYRERLAMEAKASARTSRLPATKSVGREKRAVGKPRPISFEGMNLQRGTVVAAELGGNRHVHQLYA